MTRRRYGGIAAIGAVLLVVCLAASLAVAARVRDAAAARTVSAAAVQPRQGRSAAGPGRPGGTTMVSVAAPLTACEARIGREPRRIPVVAVVGASYTAGRGPGNPELSWAVDLARLLRWNAVIYGVSGAGYVRPGDGGHGPMTSMLRQENLRGLRPALVVIQAGHDDIAVPAALEQRQVSEAVKFTRASAQAALIGLLTTFAGPAGGTPALRRTDRVIVTAGAAADRRVITMDPLAGRWTFPRASDGLHPTAAGDAWVARKVLAILRAHGVSPAAPGSGTPVICDVSVGAGRGAGKPVSAAA